MVTFQSGQVELGTTIAVEIQGIDPQHLQPDRDRHFGQFDELTVDDARNDNLIVQDHGRFLVAVTVEVCHRETARATAEVRPHPDPLAVGLALADDRFVHLGEAILVGLAERHP